MGTRSVVARPQGDGFIGRYVHWDGYPEHHVPELRAMVARDGVDTVLRVLTEEHYGWSTLDNDQAEDELGAGYRDGRFVAVPGYGVAYTEKDGQSSPDEWITSDGDDGGTEYAYVLYPDHLTVCERRDGDGSRAVGWFGMPAAEGPGAGWAVIETVDWS